MTTVKSISKASKKVQREYYNSRRNDWGNVSPITRRIESRKAYNRARAKAECRE